MRRLERFAFGREPEAVVNQLAVFRKEDVARLDSQSAVTIAVAGESSRSCSARCHRQVQWWGVQAVRVARSGSIFRVVAQPTFELRGWKAPALYLHPYCAVQWHCRRNSRSDLPITL